MDPQTTFYIVGAVFFALYSVLLVVIFLLVLSIYLKVRRLYLESKRKVERLKEVVPIVSFFIRKLNERKKKKT